MKNHLYNWNIVLRMKFHIQIIFSFLKDEFLYFIAISQKEVFAVRWIKMIKRLIMCERSKHSRIYLKPGSF